MTVAAGDVQGSGNAKRTICVLKGRTTTNSPPTAATDGVPCYPDQNDLYNCTGANFPGRASREAVLFVHNSAGSGTVTATVRLWGYLTMSGQWYPIGAGADATKGTINAGVALGESGVSDKINHCEPFYLMGMFDRLYAEVTVISGTSTAVDVYVTTGRTVSF